MEPLRANPDWPWTSQWPYPGPNFRPSWSIFRTISRFNRGQIWAKPGPITDHILANPWVKFSLVVDHPQDQLQASPGSNSGPSLCRLSTIPSGTCALGQLFGVHFYQCSSYIVAFSSWASLLVVVQLTMLFLSQLGSFSHLGNDSYHYSLECYR